ncbi:MAG: transporter substrate-binding domain-containing protein [Lachnospiraceae bacterium]|nr:transporter substrate-binding domain-containing protein [Lachnospiraceae bacterium]
MKVKKYVLIIAAVIALAAAALSSCQPSGPVAKSGKIVAKNVEGLEKTQYVMCVGKNAPKGQELIASLNKVIKATDMKALTDNYLDTTVRRIDDPAEKYDLSGADTTIDVYTTVIEPYQFSGAYGNGVDGIDVILLFDMAHDLNVKLTFHDELFQSAYSGAKAGGNTILAAGIALTDQVKQDFLVTDVYSEGYQQIVSDQNEGFTKLSQLKGLKIGVLDGRPGYDAVKKAIESGELKGTGAEMVVYNTDAEAGFGYKNEMCDVLVLDELSATMIVKRWK